MTLGTLHPNPSQAFSGIYDVPEAARYLKAAEHGDAVYPITSTKLIRWIRRGLASRELVTVHGLELLIAFEDLISMRVIAALRGAGVSWSEIDRTEHWLRNEVGVQRPFASEIIWAGQGQIFADWTGRLLSASRHGQMALEILRRYLIPIHGLEFAEASPLATSWEPLAGIRLEPRVQFGAPCVKGTRIPTRTIWGMVAAGDSEDWISSAFEISIDDVYAACEWESRLRSQ